MSVSRELVRWALALDYTRLPPEVVHEAKRALVDTLGCAIGGYECEARVIAQRTLQRIGGVEEATLIGSGIKAPALTAAVVNGIMVRYLDYNDVYVVPVGQMVAGGHSSEVIPGALALAERNHASGRDFLASVVAGYEVSGRMLAACGKASFAHRGWNTDSRGAIVMPIVAAKLLGLTEEQAVNAVGISASTGMILGILDTDEEPNTLAKNFRFPSAAHRGILAALLAQEGFTGPERVIEGQRGFVQAVFQGDYRVNVLTDGAQPFHLLANRYKPFAAESTAHGHISATLHLVSTHDLKPADIESVRVRAGTRAIAHTGDPAKRHPRDKETADHSSWYLTAVAITDRQVGPGQYSAQKYLDPVVMSLMERITLEASKEFDAHPMGGEVEIRTHSGKTLIHRVLHPKGSGQNPMSDAELEHKFRGMACRHMDEAAMARLLDRLWHIDELDDVAPVLSLFVFDRAGRTTRA